jgi:hypothetical protein
MTATRTFAAMFTALAACAGVFAVPAGARAASFDGAWAGQLTCAKLSFTTGTLKIPMDLKIDGGKATYRREVLNRDGTRVVGTEQGSGTVAADGALTLTATWTSAEDKPRFTYTASYAGKLAAGAGTLRGAQIWSFDGKTETRSCTITLAHKG